MNIAIFGTGYVGLVTGACLADVGHNVTCIDIDKEKIDGLNKGIIPIYEPGLNKVIERTVEKNKLKFTTDTSIKTATVVFIAVGTPPDEDGSADLKHVISVAKDIGKQIAGYKVIVTKSTVPVGTSEKVKYAIDEELLKRGVGIEYSVASNPEFLKEGDAIQDFMKPDRIVVGTSDDTSRTIMSKLYRPFTLNGHPIVFMDVKSAEVTKYAANAMLATKISFINEIANFCDAVGANVDDVRAGITSDSRIGKKFLYPGIGYGGSCFPKDVKALIETGLEYGQPMNLLETVDEVNDDQKLVIIDKFGKEFHKRIDSFEHPIVVGIWGLSFKPNTDDMREAPSIIIINQLLEWGISIHVYDPVAMDNAKKIFGDKIHYADSKYEAADQVDCLMLLTEWSEFKTIDVEKLHSKMTGNVIFDGRNIYDKNELLHSGFKCIGIGR